MVCRLVESHGMLCFNEWHPGMIQSDLKQNYCEFLFSFAENDLFLLLIVLDLFCFYVYCLREHYDEHFNHSPVTTDGWRRTDAIENVN